MKLRDYQTKATRRIDAEWKAGHRAVLLVMPPNAGKTVVFLHVIRKALKRGERVCVVAPNVVLTQQTIDKFSHIDHGIIWADKTTGKGKQLQIASAPTLANRLDEYDFDLIVVDEAHHCAANTWKKILERYSSARVLGVTATAKRLDGKGLDACGFTGLVRGPWIDSLTPQYMTPYRMWAPNVPELLDAPEGSDYKASDLAKHGIEMGVLIGDAVKHYTKHCAGKRALAFCMSIEDSKATVKRFARAGYKAAHMDGNTPHEERQRLLADLNARRLDLISSCNVLGEGLDIPGVDVVIQLRPTRSYQMWLQQLGRGFRLDAENPDKLLDVIDCAGNYFRFWSPSVDRGYGLDGAPSLDVERQQTQRRCAECGLVYMADGRGYCPECHAETAAAAAQDTERRAVWRDGELVQVGGGGRIERLLEDTNACGTSTFFVSKSKNLVYLGTDRLEAQRMADLANEKFDSAGFWPIDKLEFRSWFGLGPARVRGGEKRLLRQKKSNRKSDAYVVLHSLGKQRVVIHLGIDRDAAQESLDKANLRYQQEGKWPDSKEEVYRWFGRTPATKDSSLAKVYPFKDKRGTTYVTKISGRQYSLSKDESIATEKVLSAISKWIESGHEWPPNDANARALLGLQPRGDGRLKPTNRGQRGIVRFYALKRYNAKTLNVSLGTDPAIAQARVDQANARWEANGYKWPDTAEEFREWLTLPPP